MELVVGSGVPVVPLGVGVAVGPVVRAGVGVAVFFFVGTRLSPSDLFGTYEGFANFSTSMPAVAFFIYRSHISAGNDPPPMP